MRSDVASSCTGLMLLFSLVGLVGVRSSALAWQSTTAPALMGSDGRELPFADQGRLLEYLRDAEVISSTILSQGITQAERLLIQQDGTVAQVIFHDVDSFEQRTKRLSNGNTVLYVKDSYTSQVAAYEMSRLLGMDNVPPTVERKFNTSRGSAQLWIENAMTERERLEKKLEPPDQNLWNQRYSDMRVFDNLINNIDRNQGNLLIDPFWNLWLIDHTRSFGPDRTLPRPELIGRCSRKLWNRLRELDEVDTHTRLSPYLRRSEVKAIFFRRRKLIELIEKKIAAQGEKWVFFELGAPDPGLQMRESPEDSGSGND